MALSTIKRKLRTVAVKIATSKPIPYSSSLILNLLGLQIYRTFFFYVWRIVRTPWNFHVDSVSKGYLSELEKQGIVAIPDFFSEEDYKKIKEEYKTLVPNFVTSYSAILLPHVMRLHIDNPHVSDFFRSSFCNNKTIRTVATAYLGARFNLPIDPNLTRIYCLNDEEIHSPKNGGTNNLHIDAPVRTLKAFYYVSDTKRLNAAFKYCVGTNKRNSLKRLWLEYKLSVRYAYNKWNNNHNEQYKDGEPWVVVNEDEMRAYNLVENDIEVKGNTLLFADTGGFHRRGECLGTEPRETIEISFRDIDTLINATLPFLPDRFKKKEPNRNQSYD